MRQLLVAALALGCIALAAAAMGTAGPLAVTALLPLVVLLPWQRERRDLADLRANLATLREQAGSSAPRRVIGIRPLAR